MVMNRWLILGGYMLLTACTQLVWLSFAPITDAAAHDLGASVTQVGWLSAVFAGVYLLLGLPTGRLTDTHFSRALGFGAICNALGAGVRLLAPHNFAVRLLGQVILAVGQPFVVNAMSALAVRYFAPQERPKAIAAASASMFVGVLLASLSAPLLYAAGGLPLVLGLHALPTVLAALWVLLALRTHPTYDERSAADTGGWAWLTRDRLLHKLGLLLFVGFGTFSALSTWLEPLLPKGISATTSGNLLGGMVVGGIMGAATLPVWAAARGQRWSVLLCALLLTLGLLAVLALGQTVGLLALALGVGGFFLLACLPTVLEWAEEHVGAGKQGLAVGLLMLLGNAGSVALMLGVGSLVEQHPKLALGLLALSVLLGLVMLLGMRGHTAKGQS